MTARREMVSPKTAVFTWEHCGDAPARASENIGRYGIPIPISKMGDVLAVPKDGLDAAV